MPTQEKNGRKSTKSSKKRDSVSHLSTSFTHASAGKQVDASFHAQIPTENPTTAQYLHQDSVEPAEVTLPTNEQYLYSQRNDYAAVEHKGDTSQLQLWAYEVANDSLTFAERLEKAKWEMERLARL